MTVSAIHHLHSIVSASPSLTFTQLTNCTPTPGISTMTERGAGGVNPQFIGVVEARPVISFDTTQLATLLNSCGIYGVGLTGNTDHYLKKAIKNGTREANASTVHQRLRMASSFLRWTQLSADHNGKGSASCEIIACWNGSADPVVAAGNVALAGTTAATEFFGCGPIAINEVALDGVKSISVDLAQNLTEESSNSVPWLEWIGVDTVTPVITIESLAQGAWASFGLGGAPLTDFAAYLRRYENKAVRYADGNSEHILFGAASGLIVLDELPASETGPARTRIRIALNEPSPGSAPLSVTTGVAIS